MFEYQKFGRFFAPVAGKMEEFAAEEFTALGAERVQAQFRGLSFHANHETLYKIIYSTRLASRVFAPLLTFACHSTKYLVATATKMDWEQIMDLDSTFAITCSVGKSNITHSHYAALCLKDGIADHFMDKYGRRPNVDVKNPDVRLNLHILENRAVISLDLCGDALHKRGYRTQALLAPMQETLAAAMVTLSGWDGTTPLWDPMCGAGTLLAEALMQYCNIPAQYCRRRFGFTQMPDFDADLWDKVKADVDGAIKEIPQGLLRGTDLDPAAIEIAQQNLANLPYGDRVEFEAKDFHDVESYEQGTIIMNPPYGIRLETTEIVRGLYKEFGDFLKKRCNGTVAWIFVGDRSLRKAFGLKPSKGTILVNGSLEGELLKIESFKVTFRRDEAK